MSAIPGLPQVPASALPTEVRAGSPEDRKLYETALGFERVLLGQLTQAMAPSEDGDDESAKQSGLSGPYGRMLPDAMADGLLAGGGTGLAEPLYRSLRQGAGTGAGS